MKTKNKTKQTNERKTSKQNNLPIYKKVLSLSIKLFGYLLLCSSLLDVNKDKNSIIKMLKGKLY